MSSFSSLVALSTSVYVPVSSLLRKCVTRSAGAWIGVWAP